MKQSRLFVLSTLGALTMVLATSFAPKSPGYSKDDCGLKVKYTVKPATNGQANGGIELSIERGRSPYQIHWIGVGMEIPEGKKIENLKEGFYTVHITDANRCVTIVPNIKVESK